LAYVLKHFSKFKVIQGMELIRRFVMEYYIAVYHINTLSTMAPTKYTKYKMKNKRTNKSYSKWLRNWKTEFVCFLSYLFVHLGTHWISGKIPFEITLAIMCRKLERTNIGKLKFSVEIIMSSFLVNSLDFIRMQF